MLVSVPVVDQGEHFYMELYFSLGPCVYQSQSRSRSRQGLGVGPVQCECTISFIMGVYEKKKGIFLKILKTPTYIFWCMYIVMFPEVLKI